jgi:hypothetical protein
MKRARLLLFSLMLLGGGLFAQNGRWVLESGVEAVAPQSFAGTDLVRLAFYIEDAMHNRIGYEWSGVQVFLLGENGDARHVHDFPAGPDGGPTVTVSMPDLLQLGMQPGARLQLRPIGVVTAADRPGQPPVFSNDAASWMEFELR